MYSHVNRVTSVLDKIDRFWLQVWHVHHPVGLNPFFWLPSTWVADCSWSEVLAFFALISKQN